MHITKIDMTCTTCFTKIKLWTTIQLKKILFCSYWCELLKTRVKTVDHPPPPLPSNKVLELERSALEYG